MCFFRNMRYQKKNYFHSFFQNLNMEYDYDGFEDLNGFEDGLLPSQTEFVQFDPNIGVGGNYRGEKYYGSYDLGGARTGDRCKSY